MNPIGIDIITPITGIRIDAKEIPTPTNSEFNILIENHHYLIHYN